MRRTRAFLFLLLLGTAPAVSWARADPEAAEPPAGRESRALPADAWVRTDSGGAAIVAASAIEEPPPPRTGRTGFKTLVRDVVQDFGHLPSRDSALWLAAGGAIAGLVAPIDDDLNGRLGGRGGVDAFFAPGKVIGYGAVQIGAAIGTWAVGRATDKRGHVAHLGLDLLRAQVLTQSLTYGLKYAVRRDRPDGSGGYSFPSGHASTTFASATVLQRHLGWRAAVPTYAVATYVAASRLHENRHYLSDVVFGGAVGLVCGRTVTRHGRANYTLAPMAVPHGMGIALARVAN
jgi:membrane-associated phospholipid phosphatase